MNESHSKLAENLLATPEKHQQWARQYRTAENESFYEQAFDYISKVLAATPESTILDVGCGSCAHSVRLARRGFHVQAVDFSQSALDMAKVTVAEKGLANRIDLRRETLLALTFPDDSFSYIVCWGVLMHIPDIETAVAELARVLRPGGILVLSEGNKSSLEAVGLKALKALLRKEKAEIKEATAGREYWKMGSDGALVTRQADIRWLIDRFSRERVRLVRRVAGQFSEAYAMTSSPALKKLTHSLNNFWFRHVKAPGPAYGNILFLQKMK